jgi:hypothetical protein
VIRRLVELAAAEGLSAEPTLSEVDGVFVDLCPPMRVEPWKGMVVRLRQRSGALAHQVPGWMTEKAANLAAGNPYRESQRKLAEAWSRRTDHPLPRALLDFLSSGGAVPESEGWVGAPRPRLRELSLRLAVRVASGEVRRLLRHPPRHLMRQRAAALPEAHHHPLPRFDAHRRAEVHEHAVHLR